MQILIKPSGMTKINSDYYAKLFAMANTWVDVETDYLFDTQFNTKELRVFSLDVADIKDDARIGRMRCNQCGKHSIINAKCHHCQSDNVKVFYVNNTVKSFIVLTPDGFLKKNYDHVNEANKASRFSIKYLMQSTLSPSDTVLPLAGNKHACLTVKQVEINITARITVPSNYKINQQKIEAPNKMIISPQLVFERELRGKYKDFSTDQELFDHLKITDLDIVDKEIYELSPTQLLKRLHLHYF